MSEHEREKNIEAFVEGRGCPRCGAADDGTRTICQECGCDMFIASICKERTRLADENAALAAENERLREQAAEVVELATYFGRDLVRNYDHCTDAHKHNNGACRVCNAEAFLRRLATLAQEPA